MKNVSCPFCLQPHLTVKFDKRGLPWVQCQACSSRAFLRGMNHVSTLQYLSPLLAQLANEIADPGTVTAREYRAACTAFLRSLSAPQTRAADASSATAAPLAEAANG